MNELLTLRLNLKHPLTGEEGAPMLYFVKKTPEYPNGCVHSISETRQQQRKKIGEENGKILFSEDRDKNVPDHAYDCVRYYAGHRISPEAKRIVQDNPNSFFAMRKKALIPQQRIITAPSNHYRA